VDLDTIINNITAFDLGTDTYVDHRCRADLLYKSGKRMDVLISPHGSHLRSKNDVKIYLRFLPDGSSEYTSFKDVTTEHIIKSDGKGYLLLKEKYTDRVLPYQAKGQFPFRILPGEFAHKIGEKNEDILNAFIKFLEWDYDTTNKIVKVKSFQDFIDIKKSIETSIVHAYDDLRSPLTEAFQDENGHGLELMPRTRRQFRHWTAKSAESSLMNADRISRTVIKSILQEVVSNPAKHIFFSTEDNKSFGMKHDRQSVEEYKMLTSMLKAEHPKAHSAWRHTFERSQKFSSQIFHGYLMLGSAAAFLTGNPILGVGLLGYEMVEFRVARHNAKRSGSYTSIIGTLRDKTGLYRTVPNPLDMISTDYNLGMWRKSDLE
jgi:hypothetical protein